MSLRVNLRLASRKPLTFRGELAAGELDLVGLDELLRVSGPVRYEFEVTHQGESLFVQGRLELKLACECCRCLKAFERSITIADWACLVPLQGEDKALVVNDCVDLTPYLREDILLAFPRHPLCDPECRGLPAEASTDPKHAGGGQNEAASSAWAELNKLKLSG